MDNFLVFKKMMVARNKALNEEAIRNASGPQQYEEDLEEAQR